MYASDYGYAGSDCETKKFFDTNSSNDLRACYSTNWLYDADDYYYFIDHVTTSLAHDYAEYVYACYKGSVLTGNQVCDMEQGVKPTLYLNSSVQITGGTGTSTDPYTLGL